jgi:C1A family cysteine protease
VCGVIIANADHLESYISRHNVLAAAGLKSYYMTSKKFVNRSFLKPIPVPRVKQSLSSRINRQSLEKVKNLPSSFDWRSQGLVSPVLDQVKSSSVMFAVTSAVESQLAIRDNKLTTLSVQQLIDCFNYNWPLTVDNVFTYLIVGGGLDTSDSYPYHGDRGQCQFSQSDSVVSVASYANSESGDESVLQNDLVNQGPIVVLINADVDLVFYSSGIFDSSNCTSSSPNQAMLLVGYGADSATGQEYWILKNSWGTEWGIQGYLKLARNKNICGVANYPSRPILN